MPKDKMMTDNTDNQDPCSAATAPALAMDNGKALTGFVKQRLTEAGLGRTSPYAGGENNGWITRTSGSTGFSVQLASERSASPADDASGLVFNVVIDGKAAGLLYSQETQWREDDDGDSDSIVLHHPNDAERLEPQIADVFTKMGFVVSRVTYSGHQMHWDHDIDYNVYTNRPDFLGPLPTAQPPRRGFWS